jgi:hypothetical protein
VNAVITTTYWLVGRAIVEREQRGANRAAYGEALMQHLAEELSRRYGRGFSRRNLEQMRRFYVTWSMPQTVSAHSSALSKAQTSSALFDAPTFALPWARGACRTAELPSARFPWRRSIEAGAPREEHARLLQLRDEHLLVWQLRAVFGSEDLVRQAIERAPHLDEPVAANDSAAPATGKRAAAHAWAFKPRFRRNAFGWKSLPAITRVREAVSEIKKVARTEPVVAAEGAVLFLERLSAALSCMQSGMHLRPLPGGRLPLRGE